MIMGPRPSLGWVLYLLVNKSWMRMVYLTIGLLLVTFTLLRRSKDSITLNFTRPSPYEPPVLFLPRPNEGPMTAMDACGIESASKAPVYVYLWSSNVSPADIWVRIIAKLPNINLAFLDKNKAVKRSPISGMFSIGGSAGKSDWAVWMACSASLLWTSGGILMTNGVVFTQPFYMNHLKPMQGSRRILTVKNGRIKHNILGFNKQDDFIKNILKYLESYEEGDNLHENDVTHLENLLEKALKASCNNKNVYEIHKSEFCQDFTLLNETSFRNLDFYSPYLSEKEEETVSFLNFTFDSYGMAVNDRAILRLFDKHKLYKFCPVIHSHLQKSVFGNL